MWGIAWHESSEGHLVVIVNGRYVLDQADHRSPLLAVAMQVVNALSLIPRGLSDRTGTCPLAMIDKGVLDSPFVYT